MCVCVCLCVCVPLHGIPQEPNTGGSAILGYQVEMVSPEQHFLCVRDVQKTGDRLPTWVANHLRRPARSKR